MNVLEELRRQRELIRQHLDWLEQRITALENEADEAEGVEGDEANDQAGKEKRDASTDKDANQVAETEAEKLPVAKDDDEALKRELMRHKEPLVNQIQQAKIGCLVLFLGSTLLFLFLLFGLPYLWD